MAKTMYAIEYLGALSIKQGQMYTSADILAKYTKANVMKIKTNTVNISVNYSDMFPLDVNDEIYIVIGHTYIFDRGCTIAVGRYVNPSQIEPIALPMEDTPDVLVDENGMFLLDSLERNIIAEEL